MDREREIRSFVPQTFFTVQVSLSKGGEKFPGEILAPPDLKQVRFSDKAAAEKDASRRFKFRASKTDALAQELYEAGFISYPRTECRFLPTSLVPSIPNLLKPLEVFPELAPALKLVTPAAIKAATTGKKYVDDSKLTDHQAIIPTTASPKSLTPDQQKLYLLIEKRFISIFLPPYVLSSMTVLIKSNGQTIRATGRAVAAKGYSILYDGYTLKGSGKLVKTSHTGTILTILGTLLIAALVTGAVLFLLWALKCGLLVSQKLKVQAQDDSSGEYTLIQKSKINKKSPTLTIDTLKMPAARHFLCELPARRAKVLRGKILHAAAVQDGDPGKGVSQLLGHLHRHRHRAKLHLPVRLRAQHTVKHRCRLGRL